jgi:hypothetical protein
MKKVKNQRKYLRHPWEGTVTYRWSVPRQPRQVREFSGQGQLQNMSGGGLCLMTEERLAPKQLLSVSVPLQSQDLAIPTLAYVQWTRPVRGTGRYAAGLSFLI